MSQYVRSSTSIQPPAILGGGKVFTVNVLPLTGLPISGANATGRPHSDHVFYAENSGRWWALYIDVSSQTTLRAAWTTDFVNWNVAATSATLSLSVVTGFNFAVAYKNISSNDVVHIGYGQRVSATSHRSFHLRATISGTTITFGSSNEVTPASTATDGGDFQSGLSVVIGASNTIYHASSYVEAVSGWGNAHVATSTNTDSGASWTAGFGTPVKVVSPSSAVGAAALFDLGTGIVLGLFDNGAALTTATDITWSKLSGGTWSPALPPGNVFGTSNSQDKNDWGAVARTAADIHVVRRTGTNTFEHDRFNGTDWTTLAGASIPTQNTKAGAGLFLASNGTDVWLFIIDTDADNSVRYCKWSLGSATWGTWTAFETTTQVRTAISGYRTSADAKVTVLWTENANSLVAESLTTAIPTTVSTSPVVGGRAGIAPTNEPTGTATITPGWSCAGYADGGYSCGYNPSYGAGSRSQGANITIDAQESGTSVNAQTATGTGDAQAPQITVASQIIEATSTGTAVDSAATTALLAEDFESFSSFETWADASTHGQWFVQFDGKAIGDGVGIETDSGSKVHFQLPDVATDPDEGDETHASLVTSISTFRSDVQYFELSSRVKTVQQLRQNLTPHAWEVAWLVWHYIDNDHFYYFTLKPNGYELGKRHPAYAGSQRFLATGASPTLTIGAWNRFRIVQSTDATITVYVDGTQIAQFQDTGGPQGDAAYIRGSIGLYNEDAYVRFDDIAVNAAIPQSATATGDAQNASTNVSASAAGATGTGDSQSPQDTVAPIVQIATATGDAQNTQTTIVVNAIEATAVGDGLNATTTTANVTNVNAAEATGTGDAQNIAATVASNIQATTTVGDGQNAQASIFPNAIAATATGDAQQAQGTNVAPIVQSADATGDALQPAILTGTLAFAQLADAAGDANAITPDIKVNSQQIVNAGDAQQPTVITGTQANAQEATGTGVAQDTQISIKADGQLATATGDAQQPQAAPQSDQPQATGQAQDATIKVAPVVDIALGTGTAHDPTISIGGFTSVNAITAAGTGDGQGITPSIAPSAILITATGDANDGQANLRALAELATALGAAFDAEFSTGQIVAIPHTTYILSNILTTYVEIADTAERKSNELVLGVGV